MTVVPLLEPHTYCVQTPETCVGAVGPVLRDLVGFGGPCFGPFDSPHRARQFTQSLSKECWPTIVKLPVPETYVHEGKKYTIAEAPFLVELGYIEQAFEAHRPLDRDTVIVETRSCQHFESYHGPFFILDAPTGRVHILEHALGVGRKSEHELFVSHLVSAGLLTDDATPAVARLAKRFKVPKEQIKKAFFERGDGGPDETARELAYLGTFDLRTGKTRELPLVGGTELWSVGAQVFSYAFPCRCNEQYCDREGWLQVLSRNPLRWKAASTTQAKRAKHAINSPDRFVKLAPGKPIAVTRDRSLGLFLAAIDDPVWRAIVYVGRSSAE